VKAINQRKPQKVSYAGHKVVVPSGKSNNTYS